MKKQIETKRVIMVIILCMLMILWLFKGTIRTYLKTQPQTAKKEIPVRQAR